MKKNKTALISIAVVAALGLAVWLGHQQRLTRQENTRLQQRLSELVSSNVLLGEEASRLASYGQALGQSNEVLRATAASLARRKDALEAQLQDRARNPNPAAPTESEPGTIRLRKENLNRVQFEAINQNWELTETAKDLLQLTPEELARITRVLQEIQQRVQTHDLAAARQAPIGEIKDKDIIQFLERTPGQPTAFRIPPFSQSEQAVLRQWFEQTLDSILGPERRLSFLRNSRLTLDFWLGGTEDKIIAFVDQVDSNNAPVSHWMVKFNTPSSQGTHSGASRHDPVPPQFKYLFDIHQPSN